MIEKQWTKSTLDCAKSSRSSLRKDITQRQRIEDDKLFKEMKEKKKKGKIQAGEEMKIKTSMASGVNFFHRSVTSLQAKRNK